MTQEEFRAAVHAAAPHVKITEVDRYLHLSELVEMEVKDYSEGRWKKAKVYCLSQGGNAMTSEGFFGYARPIPGKKKRLMTPAECAGKWLCLLDTRYMITAFFSDGKISAGGEGRDVAYWHSSSFKIADTPTSEPYSLEVEE